MARLTSRGSGTRSLWVTGAMLCVAGITLSGCVAEDPLTQIRAFLATERDSRDALPDNAATDGLDMDSSRLVGERDGIKYFVAAYNTSGACIFMVDETSGTAGSACGDSPNLLMSVVTNTGGVKVYKSTDEIPEGWTQLGDFLIVNPDATVLQ